MAGFIAEAGKRGFRLRAPTLRELYRRQLLVPLAQVTRRPVSESLKPEVSDSPLGGSQLLDLRWARDTGRLRDPTALPYQRRLSFEAPKQTWPETGPWTGVLYSPYQLLALPELESMLAKQTYQKRGSQIIARLPEPHPLLLDRMLQLRNMVIALTELEARYLPNLDPEFIHLRNVLSVDDWANYRDGFDPVQTMMWLAYTPEQIRQDAERLLLHAHSVDPVGNRWSELMRRAPAKSRDQLKDAALIAMDDRIAAEILLRFYDDLASRGYGEPLPDFSGEQGWHPLVERLSFHADTLDETLTELGISPYPRVVVALEGETEAYHAPLVRTALGMSEAPEIMRFLNLGTVNRDLTKVVALAVAPLVSEKIPGTNAWRLIRPSAHLVLAVDPDSPFNTPASREKERAKLLTEIRDILKAQGVLHPNPEELDALIQIRVWEEPCYEFANFTDEELADGIMGIHHTIDGWTREQLIEALKHWRDKGTDIKRVWESGRWIEESKRVTGKWEYEVQKTKLAEALWPTLEKKIKQVRENADAPLPPIVKVISDAYHLAQQRRYLLFVLTEVEDTAGEARRIPATAMYARSPSASRSCLRSRGA